MADIEVYKQAELALQNAQGVYLDHQKRLDAATVVIDTLYEKARQEMTDDLYNNIGSLIKKLNNTIDAFKESRSPITQAASALVKVFTSQENILDVKNPSTKVFQLKKFMDDYAEEKERVKRAKDYEEKLRIDKEREINSLRISASSFLEKTCNDYFYKIKNDVMAMVNSISLENYDLLYNKIKGIKYDISEREILGTFSVTPSNLVSYEQKGDIIAGLLLSDGWNNQKLLVYQDISIYIQETLQTLPSIKRELEDLSLASKAETERILRDKQNREALQKAEMEETRLKAEQDLLEQEKMKQTQQSIQSAFEFGVSKAELATGIKTKSTYEITLAYPSGLLEIVNFWITHQKWPMEEVKVLPVSFDRMIRFAEKEASNGEMIKSQFVVYKEKTSAKI